MRTSKNSKKVLRESEAAAELVGYWTTREGLLPRARGADGAVRLHTRKLFARFERFMEGMGDSRRVTYREFRVALAAAGFEVRAQWTWANKALLHARMPD